MRYSHLFVTAVCFLSYNTATWAVRVPSTAPKALKETQQKEAVAQHAEAAKESGALIPESALTQIHEMVTGHSKRADQPAETFRVTFKKDGSIQKWVAEFPRNAQRTPNESKQDHDISRASFDAKSGKIKVEAETRVEGPDLFELFALADLPIVVRELTAVQKLQQAFIKSGLNYALEAEVIVAPDGKSWAWQIAPSEEQMPNVIYGLYYYPITHELHSIHLDTKATAKLEKAAKEAGLSLQWVKEMNDR